MKYNDLFVELRGVLADLYLNPSDARRIASQVGLDLRYLELGNQAINNWDAILRKAISSDKLDRLLAAVDSECNDSPAFTTVYAVYQSVGMHSSTSTSHNRSTGDLLHFLPDRHDQELALSDAIQQCQQARRPLVCLIFGNDDECHDKFVERLYLHSLRSHLGLDPMIPIKHIPLPFPQHTGDANDFHRRLRFSLVNPLLGRSQATIAEVNAHLVAHRAPTVLHTYLRIQAWQKHEETILRNFLEFWQEWPELAFDQWLLVCICLRCEQQPRNRLKFWQRQKQRMLYQVVEEALSSLLLKDERIVWAVLPPLQEVHQADAEYWALHDDVQRICRGHDVVGDIAKIYERWARTHRSNVIPMRHLAGELRNLLLRYKQLEEDLI